MKKNDLHELRSETLDKLKARLLKEKKELINLSLEAKTKKIKDVRKIFHKRKDIAAILTIIAEKGGKT